MTAKKVTSEAIADTNPKPENFLYRPRISHKVRTYLIDLVIVKILAPKKIITEDKNAYNFTFSLKPNNDSDRPNRMAWEIKTISGVKDIAIYFYNDAVSQDMTPYQYTNVLFDGLKTFLTEKYKKITPEEMEAVRQQIDWAYIDNLPFPAPFEDQQYILDANPDVEAAYRQQFKE